MDDIRAVNGRDSFVDDFKFFIRRRLQDFFSPQAQSDFDKSETRENRQRYQNNFLSAGCLWHGINSDYFGLIDISGFGRFFN